MININEKKYGKLSWHKDDKVEYKELKSSEETQKWGQAHYENWSEQYKQIMQMSKGVVKTNLCTEPLECYCGYSYQQINEFLRCGKDNEDHTYRELSDILSMVLCSAPRIPCALVLYRMVDDCFICRLIENNRQEKPIQEKGFMSTSLLKNIANKKEYYATRNNLLKIFVPKDTIGVYVDAVTKRSEEEMLLLPNMYLGLISYPYKDKEIKKTVYECQLIKFY